MDRIILSCGIVGKGQNTGQGIFVIVLQNRRIFIMSLLNNLGNSFGIALQCSFKQFIGKLNGVHNMLPAAVLDGVDKFSLHFRIRNPRRFRVKIIGQIGLSQIKAFSQVFRHLDFIEKIARLTNAKIEVV